MQLRGISFSKLTGTSKKVVKMRYVGLYFKAFAQKMLSPVLPSEILTGIVKVYGSEMNVPICPADSSHLLFLHAETVSFAILLFQLGSWCLIPFSMEERKGIGSIAQVTRITW